MNDLLAFEIRLASFLLRDVLDHRRGLAPVGRDHREYPWEHRAVGGVGAAIANGNHRNLVCGDAIDQAIGNAGRKRLHQRSTVTTLLFQPLVAFNAAGVVVFGLALRPYQLDAVDSTVLQVDVVHVVDVPAKNPGTPGSVRAHAIRQQRHELLRRENRAGCQDEPGAKHPHALISALQ